LSLYLLIVLPNLGYRTYCSDSCYMDDIQFCENHQQSSVLCDDASGSQSHQHPMKRQFLEQHAHVSDLYHWMYMVLDVVGDVCRVFLWSIRCITSPGVPIRIVMS